MSSLKRAPWRVVVLCACLSSVFAQEPQVTPARSAASQAGDLTPAAIAGSKQDPAAVARGTKVYATYCAGCHGAAGKGGAGAPDLIRSLLVLDDEKGLLIAPVIREGRPDKGMPKLGLNETQIADVVAWLHVRTYSAGHRGTYVFQDVVTGDAKKGEAYFNGAGGCSGCHSASGDLAGIGKKFDAFSLQQRWLQPRNSRGSRGANAVPGSAVKVTVTPPSGEAVSGQLDRLDDFTVSLRDANGVYHSYARENEGTPRIEIHDPLKAHADMLRKYTDPDIHNVTAYLVTLK